MSPRVVLLFAIVVASLAGEVRAEGKRYALVIGVKTYRPNQSLPPLSYTENDAERLAKVLGDAGYKVTLMTQSSKRAELVPMADFIRDQLDGMLGNPFLDRDEDVVVVALAGHGVYYDQFTFDGDGQPVLDDEGQPKKSPRFYFCPADADLRDFKNTADGRQPKLKRANDVMSRNHLLDVDEIYQRLAKCKAGGKLLLVDACRNDPSKPKLDRSLNSLTLPPIPEPPGGVAAFFACSQDEEAKEDPDLEHGVFFNYVIKGLTGAADTSRPGRPADGRIGLTELAGYVGPEVYDHVRLGKKFGGARQTPELKGKFRLTIPLVSITRITGSEAGESRTFGAGLGIEMAWCPPGEVLLPHVTSADLRTTSGSFTRGATMTEGSRQNARIVSGFWVGKHKVTVAQYEQLQLGKPVSNDEDDRKPRHPAQVSWTNAMLFCRKLTERERSAGRLTNDEEYRMSTFAEWRYALVAGTKTRYFWGDGLSNAPEYVHGEFSHSFPVGTREPNAWGLHDMIGNNTGQWCMDYLPRGQFPGGVAPRVGRGEAYTREYAGRSERFRVIVGTHWFSDGDRNFEDSPQLRGEYIEGGLEGTPYYTIRLVRTQTEK